jgi:NTP pyrophosphatase (non-canonical NTP hydrolase)
MSNILDEQLTPRTIEYLEILQEECAEVVQAVSKIKRFGLHSFNPADKKKVQNIEHLITEIGDVMGMVKLLTETELGFNHGLNLENISKAGEKKVKKVAKYLQT